MTNLWMDIKHADVITVMGGNAAEAHPCGFKWVVEAKAHNNAKLIVVDPRFTRTASVADLYCPIRQGTDIAFLSGVAKYLLDNDKLQHRYVSAYTNAGYVVREGYDFSEGLFTGYDADKRDYDKTTWDYEIGPDGYAVVDETMQHPRCVMQLLKKHVSLYTPEMVEKICGSPKETFLKVCEMMATTASPRSRWPRSTRSDGPITPRARRTSARCASCRPCSGTSACSAAACRPCAVTPTSRG